MKITWFRVKVYEFIKAHPWVDADWISQEISMGMTMVTRIITALEAHDFIEALLVNGKKYYSATRKELRFGERSILSDLTIGSPCIASEPEAPTRENQLPTEIQAASPKSNNMKVNENDIKVIAYLKSKPNSQVEDISEATGVFKLSIHKSLKKLVAEEYISSEQVNEKLFYKTTDKELPQEITTVEEPNIVESNVRVEEIKKVIPAGSKSNNTKEQKQKSDAGPRDFKTYRFEGQTYGKGMLALAIVTKYCEEYEPTFGELLEAFPNSIVSSYGVVKLVADAKKLSETKKRYFINDDQLIRLKDKKKVAVTNQWTSERIKTFIKIAKDHGYKLG